MDTDVCFDSGKEPTKEINWNQPIVELNKLWHTGIPEKQGTYLVKYRDNYRIAIYDGNTFGVRQYGMVIYTKEIDRWCLIKDN